MEKVLNQFCMDKSFPLSTPIMAYSLDIKKDRFSLKEDNEELLGPGVPYLSVIGALIYLANCTRPNIAFVVNLLARHSLYPLKGIEMVLSTYYVILKVLLI